MKPQFQLFQQFGIGSQPRFQRIMLWQHQRNCTTCYSLLSSLFFLMLKYSRFGHPEPFQVWHAPSAFEHKTVLCLHPVLFTLHWTLNLSFSPKRHCRILNTFSQTFLAFPTKSGAMWLSWEGTTCGRPAKAKKREMSHNIAGLPIWVGFLHL